MNPDEIGYFVLDTVTNVLHGADGGPFPYKSKATAASVAAKKNASAKAKRRYRAVTWLALREI